MSTHRFQIIGAISATLFAIASSAAGAEMYKWVNDDGSTTYSNQPPADLDSVEEFSKIEAPRAEPLPPPVKTYPSQTTSSVLVEPRIEPETRPARPSVRSNLPLAVQDPCLTSSDRYCYLKHKDQYRPYIGYMPYEPRLAEASTVPPPPRGATTGASAGGAVGGESRGK